MKIGLGLSPSFSMRGGNSVAKQLEDAYNVRVLADGGTIEGALCAQRRLATFTGTPYAAGQSQYDAAYNLVIPSGYKASVLYAQKPIDGSGDWGVVRADTAYRMNSAGLLESVAANVPRLDWFDPVTGGVASCPALLVEGAATNQALRSQKMDNVVSWVPSNATVTADTTIAPDGTLTADTVTYNTAAGFQRQDVTISGGVIIGDKVTWSQYVMSSTRTLVFGGATPAGTDVYSIQNIGGGWYRQILTRTFTANGPTVQILPRFTTSGGTGVRVFWGTQVERGEVATSYIPTTTTAVTRNADVITLTPPMGATQFTTRFQDGTSTTGFGSPYQLPIGRINSTILL